MRDDSDRIAEKIETHFSCSVTLKNGALYEIMWKNLVDPDRPHVTT